MDWKKKANFFLRKKNSPKALVPPLSSICLLVGLRPTHLRTSPSLAASTKPSLPSQKSNKSNTSLASVAVVVLWLDGLDGDVLRGFVWKHLFSFLIFVGFSFGFCWVFIWVLLGFRLGFVGFSFGFCWVFIWVLLGFRLSFVGGFSDFFSNFVILKEFCVFNRKIIGWKKLRMISWAWVFLFCLKVHWGKFWLLMCLWEAFGIERLLVWEIDSKSCRLSVCL